jgi:type II secretory pathway component PulF
VKPIIPISDGKLRFFAQSLGFLLEGGVPLEEALFLLGETEKTSRMSRLYREMGRKIMQGVTFYQALDQVFYPIKKEYRCLIQSGGVSGGIIPALRELDTYLERKTKNRETLGHALAYPLLLVMMMVAGAMVFTHTVLPRSLELFESLPGNGSLTANLLEERIESVKGWMDMVLTVLPLSALLVFLWNKRPGERTGKIDRFLGGLTPGIFKDRELFLYLTTLSLLLNQGVPLSEALDKAGEGLSGALNCWKHRRILDLIASGEPAGLVLLNEKFFPDPYSRWFAFSEMTGELKQGVELMRREFEQRLIRRSRRITSLAEPVLICLAGGFLLILSVVLILPFFEMMGGML